MQVLEQLLGPMMWPLLIIGGVGLIVLILKGGSFGFPYVPAGPLLTPAERKLFAQLQRVVGGRALIFAKVRVADLITVKKGLSGKARMSALGRISQKHVDFVVVDPHDMKPVALIELDDPSHRQRTTRKRDDLVNKAYQAAGLKLIRIKTKEVPTDEELSMALFPPAPGVPSSATRAVLGEAPHTAPDCAKCGASMVKRRGSKGWFWGCTTFPRCRHTVQLEA